MELGIILYPEGFDSFKEIMKGGDKLQVSHSRVDLFKMPIQIQNAIILTNY